MWIHLLEAEESQEALHASQKLEEQCLLNGKSVGKYHPRSHFTSVHTKKANMHNNHRTPFLSFANLSHVIEKRPKSKQVYVFNKCSTSQESWMY